MTALPPVAYLTDGKRLVEIVGVGQDESIMVHDVCNEDETTVFTIERKDYVKWKKVDSAA